VMDALQRHAVDVLLLDLAMPGMDGLAAIRALRQKGILPQTLVLTGAVSDNDALELIGLGVRGIILKEEAPRTLIDSIRAVARGERRIEQRLMERALDAALRATADPRGAGPRLTPAERNVLRLVCAGMPNKKVARELGISEATAKLHLHHVFRKLDVRNRVQLTLRARELGLH